MVKQVVGIFIFVVLSIGCAFAAARPLPVDQAFQLSGVVNQGYVDLQWQIAPGYYLYKSQFRFQATKGDTARLGEVILPQGDTKKDVLHGVFQSYSHELKVRIPVKNAQGQLNMIVGYQGCSIEGFCYPPIKKTISVNLATVALPHDLADSLTSPSSSAHKSFSVEDQSYSTQVLAGHHVFLIMLTFLGLGLLLAFTPCVLPMVPILSSIIAGQGQDLSTRKAFFLSLSYVLGMALTYAVAGMIVALLGSSVQVALQKPGVIIAFTGLFTLLAFSLFGFFEIRLPNALQQRIASRTNQIQGGALLSVFVMGAFSTLIVSPCVSAPLVGVLAYIGNSGDVMLGGVALLALGLGMGIPLLLVGMFEGRFLPKAGMWMDKVKQFFGFLMLGVAIWMVQRILPATVSLCLWGVLATALAVFIWKLTHTKKVWSHLNKTLGLGMLSYGLILVMSAVLGYTDPLTPWQVFSHQGVHSVAKTPFSIVTNMQQLDRQLAIARDNGKQVILDFYADWCSSCVIMDKRVFSQRDVRSALKDFVVLRADVTKNNEFDKALLARFQVIAPPTMVFFNTKGEVIPQQQIVGEINAKQFLSDLARLRSDNAKLCKTDAQTC